MKAALTLQSEWNLYIVEYNGFILTSFCVSGSLPFLRTFSAALRPADTSDHVDFLNLAELDSWNDGSGSGSELQQEPAKGHGGRGSHHHPQKDYIVSEEAKGFLRGRLATSFVPTVYTLVFIVSVPLNLVAMVMFVHPVRPRKPAVIYMLNLACADLLFGLLLPFKIAYHYHGNNWIYGSFMCRVVTAAFYCNMNCSVLLMTCISIDRFLAVVYPINSLMWRSPQTASAVCASMWLLALGGVVPLLASGQTIHLQELGITTCHDVQDADHLKAYYHYFFPIYSSVFFFLPLAFTVVCYVRIIQALAAVNVENRSRKTRALVMAVTVLVVFVVCFTPTNIILMVHYVQLSYKSSDNSYQAYLLSMCMGSLSCCLDPVLYYFGSSQCQRQVAALLRCRRLARTESSSETQSTRSSVLRDSCRSSKMEIGQIGEGSQYSRLVPTQTWGLHLRGAQTSLYNQP